MNDFRLEKHLTNWSLDAETLASAFDVEAVSAGCVTAVNTAPCQISFGAGRFVANFYFVKGEISHIVLFPYIENIDSINKYDNGYQTTKFEYCTAVLKQIYGDKVTITEDTARYKEKNYIIECDLIKKEPYTYDGGNIMIKINNQS